MEQKELSVRMKIRKFKGDKEKLSEIVASKESSDLEKKVASEYLSKLDGASEKVEAPVPEKKPVAQKSEEKEAKKADAAPVAPEKKPVANPDLSEDDAERLEAAEKKFDERQANRKTPSKSDKSMREPKKKVHSNTNLHEGKRENLSESSEVVGLKVGSIVLIGEEKGEVVRLYRSSDGKEKCMVKLGEGKPVKKRVTSVELVK